MLQTPKESLPQSRSATAPSSEGALVCAALFVCTNTSINQNLNIFPRHRGTNKHYLSKQTSTIACRGFPTGGFPATIVVDINTFNQTNTDSRLSGLPDRGLPRQNLNPFLHYRGRYNHFSPKQTPTLGSRHCRPGASPPKFEPFSSLSW